MGIAVVRVSSGYFIVLEYISYSTQEEEEEEMCLFNIVCRYTNSAM